jgi:hypothetical protein
MKRIAPIAIAIFGLAAGAFAQSASDPISKALLAAPLSQRLKKEDVTVIKWKPDFTYDTLQTGSSDLVCYDLSGYPGHPPFTVECTSKGNLPRVAQNLKFEAMGDRKTVQAALEAAEKDGTRVKPVYGSAFIHLMGADQEHARNHLTIAVPGATTASTGLPDKPNPAGAWLMNPGTSTAHIMLPDPPRT